MFCISFDFPDCSDLLDSPKSFDFTDCSCLCARHIYSFTRYVLVNRQWGSVTAGDYALPISFASNYSVVANDTGSAAASIKIEKKTNSIVNFRGRDYTGSNYNTPTVIFIAVGV